MYNPEIGDIVRLNSEWAGNYNTPLKGRFRGEVVGFSKGMSDINGQAVVKVKRLDLNSQVIQRWGRMWLEREAK